MDSLQEYYEIDNRRLREEITDHLGFENWYIMLRPGARDLFHAVMEGDVTPELILSAQEVPEQDRHGFDFVEAVANGNPDSSIKLALTNVVLSEIISEIEFLNKKDPGK
jgi:hypothetical protein